MDDKIKDLNNKVKILTDEKWKDKNGKYRNIFTKHKKMFFRKPMTESDAANSQSYVLRTQMHYITKSFTGTI